jgi:DNA-binding GntR family transcriptional regulator
MCQLSGRKRLSQEIGRIRHAVRPYILMFVKEFDAHEMQGFEHVALLKAVLSEDADFAAETMRHHVQEPINGLKAFLLAREKANVQSTKLGGKRL